MAVGVFVAQTADFWRSAVFPRMHKLPQTCQNAAGLHYAQHFWDDDDTCEVSTMKSVVQTENAPKAIGPYSQGIRVRSGELLFLSGQIPLTPAGELVGGDIESQTEQVLMNLEAVLTAGGSSLRQVLKTTVFLKNLDDFPRMNAVYERFFRETPPARSTVEVSRLPRQVAIEIDVVAAVG